MPTRSKRTKLPSPVDVSPDDPVLGPYFHEWFGTDREKLGAFSKRFVRELIEASLDEWAVEDVVDFAEWLRKVMAKRVPRYIVASPERLARRGAR